MGSKKLKIGLIAMALALMPTLVAGCAAGVTQEQYDAVVAERDAANVQIANLESELAAAQEQTSILPTVSIYDEEDLLEISIEDFAKYHGDICPCGTMGFRATQLAIAQLWGGQIPVRGDFKIISACPTRGSKDAVEFITRVVTRKKGADFEVQLPEGTDIENLSFDNYVFTFIRKSTGDEVDIRVKEEIFPPGFLEMRKKVKFEGTATEEEKKAFKQGWLKLRDGCLSLSLDEIFEFEKK